MKITNKMRFMLVMLSVVMALSLFACARTPEETTTKAPVETTEKPTETTERVETTESAEDPVDTTAAPEAEETTEAPAEETTEAPAEETTETTEAPACDHAETETETAVAPTCEETGLTEGSYCAICGETITAQVSVPALGHAYEGVVTVQPDCENAGVMTYTCANDATHTYTEELAPIGHVHAETYEDGEDGKRNYVISCESCGDELYNYTMQLGETAPELIITADALAQQVKATGTRISDAVVSPDGAYVTIFNTPMVKGDGFFTVYTGDGSVTGRYMLIKYRTTCQIAQQIWAGANNGGDAPVNADGFYIKHQENNACGGLVADGDWRVTVIDLAALKDGRFLPETEGENEGKYSADYIKWSVFSLPTAKSESVDVAFIALADDISELLAIEGTKEYVFVKSLLGGIAVAEPLNALTDNPFFDPAFIVTKVANESIATVKKDEANNNMPYAELKSTSDTGEQKFFVWQDTENMTKNSGNYLGYLYRRSADSKSNITIDFFINSNSTAPNKVASKANIATIADGTWQLKIVNISGMDNHDNEAYYDPEMGIASLRFDYFNGNRQVGETIDIAFIATFDTEAQAAEVLSSYYMSFFNGGAQICEHTSVTNVSFFDDGDENTVYALEKFDCLVCRQNGLVRRAGFGAALENIGANTQISASTSLMKMETMEMGVWTVGSIGYPSDGYITPDAEGKVTANGWVGVNGDTTKAAYMVLDENGNVLLDWTVIDGKFKNEQSPITSAILSYGHGINPVGRRFSMSVDVSAFAGKTVSIVYAVIPNSIPAESGDKYVPIFEIQGIKVPAAE